MGRNFWEGKGEPDRSILGSALGQDRCAVTGILCLQNMPPP